MNDRFLDVRSGFCLLFVVALHVAIIFALCLKNDVASAPQVATRYLQYVAVISPLSSLQNSSTDINKSAPKKGAFTHSVSIIEPAADAKSAQPEVLPKLNLDALRNNAARYELDRQRSSIELEQEKNRQNRSLEARLEKEAKKAARTDCREAHAQTGLFAPLFIAADLLSDKGCKF